MISSRLGLAFWRRTSPPNFAVTFRHHSGGELWVQQAGGAKENSMKEDIRSGSSLRHGSGRNNCNMGWIPAPGSLEDAQLLRRSMSACQLGCQPCQSRHRLVGGATVNGPHHDPTNFEDWTGQPSRLRTRMPASLTQQPSRHLNPCWKACSGSARILQGPALCP